MTKVIKTVIMDDDTGEFYTGMDGFALKFSKDISKANLYSKVAQNLEVLRSVKSMCQRNIVTRDVEVTFTLQDESIMVSKLDEVTQKEQKLFEKLTKLAEKDVDSMSEKDYRKWKSLKKKYG